MRRPLILLMAIIFCASPALAADYTELMQCVRTCLDSWSTTPTTPTTPTVPTTPTTPTTGTKAFPDSITFDNTSDQGSGSYSGTACILFPESWEGRIQKVVVNGETALHGISYKGRPVFRLLKTGDQYIRPLKFTITGSDGQVYTATSGSTSTSNGGAVTGTTGGSVSILWKPVADSGGMLVVLLPNNMGTPSVSVLDMGGKLIETGVFKYYSNPNRATYRFTRPGRSFPSPCILKVGSTLYLVRDASKRNESLPSYIR